MIKKIAIQSILALITVGLWFTSLRYPDSVVMDLFFTALSFTLIYLIFKILLEETLASRVRNRKTRYSFRKIVSILYLSTFLIILFRIWIEDPQALLVTYGLIAAGVAISLQDFFKSLVGGVLIIMTGLYTVGDRVELEGRYGDVIDIGILSTTLLEIREWVDGEQPTGRVITIPNKVMISGTIINYTKDNNFLWDEIKISIEYGSDWKGAIEIIEKITEKETTSMAEKASEELRGLQEKYYITDRSVVPSVYVKINDDRINLSVRYITDARARRDLHDKLSRKIFEALRKEENIDIAG
ncbi:MAG: mechanosensitive ion channel family protein [Candidatus Natronoplasma sp.]